MNFTLPSASSVQLTGSSDGGLAVAGGVPPFHIIIVLWVWICYVCLFVGGSLCLGFRQQRRRWLVVFPLCLCFSISFCYVLCVKKASFSCYYKQYIYTTFWLRTYMITWAGVCACVYLCVFYIPCAHYFFSIQSNVVLLQHKRKCLRND